MRTNFLPVSPYSAPSEMYSPASVRRNSVNSTLSSVTAEQSIQRRYVASARMSRSSGRLLAMNAATVCLFWLIYPRRASSHSPPCVKAATAASTANAFGSAISSVLSARHTLWRKNGSGTATAAVCIPAMLNAFVGAMQVMLFLRQLSETDANGTYSFPGSVRSQCISSDITVT